VRHFALRLSFSVALIALAATASAQVQELPNVPVVSSGWQEKFWIHPDGTKFHYFEWGTGTPVILIHGSGGTALNWMMNGLGAGLATTNRVIAIDMRGHGQTVGPDGRRQRRTPNMDLDVLAFMDGMKIQRTHIGGFSMGGSLTSQLLARAPERFITAHFGGSGVREDPEGEFAKLIPPDPQGTAPLDAEARRLYQARQAAEAKKAGVSPNGDESQLSSQPVPAEVPRPPLKLEKIDFPILAVVGEFGQPHTRTHRLWREAPISARDPAEPRALVIVHGRHHAGVVS
jgi:pimeloyl-ACP methyl ester carboxylesterase